MQLEPSGIFQHTFAVPQDAVDENGHVNNVAYVQWMQDAAVRHSDRQGCTRETKAIGATWVVRSHRIEYFLPAFAGDRIAVLTWVSDFRKVRSLRKYKFLRLEDNALLAVAETDWVFVDAASGRPRAIPKEISDAFEIVPVDREP
jgi:acyl-CoA thioester hydrolase